MENSIYLKEQFDLYNDILEYCDKGENCSERVKAHMERFHMNENGELNKARTKNVQEARGMSLSQLVDEYENFPVEGWTGDENVHFIRSMGHPYSEELDVIEYQDELFLQHRLCTSINDREMPGLGNLSPYVILISPIRRIEGCKQAVAILKYINRVKGTHINYLLLNESNWKDLFAKL